MEDWVATLEEHARSALRPADGRLQLPGLRAEVEVLTDRWGVPHVYAGGLDDLYLAQGYLHASERLWQVDFTRRVPQGRLAEVVGEPGLPTDRFFRTLGLGRTARRWLARVDEDTRRIGEPYAGGFRAGIAANQKPAEYQLLGLDPEFGGTFEDAAVDSFSIALLMAFTLSTNWPFELLRAELARVLGPERARELTPFLGIEAPIAVPQSPSFPGLVRDLTGAAFTAGAGRRGTGSNNWVVAGSKSETGAPLLANDPHLVVQMPAIWMEMHLACPEMEVAGVTLPGIPGAIIGHNRRIAWGFTNTQADVEDLYLERLSDDGARYEYRGAWKPVRVVRERIFVRGERKPRVHEVRVTRHGPLLTATIQGTLDPKVREGTIREALALRWIHYDVVSSQGAIEALNRAENWEEFRAAARRWPAAGQNMVYADVEGNIGYQFTGTVPIRAQGSGAAPLPGWTGEHEWKGAIPFDDLPSALNPATGFVATANNRMVDLDYPYYLTNDWEPPHRIRRIVALLTATEKLSREDFVRLQLDTRSGVADELVPLFLRARVGDGKAAEAFKQVELWDRRLEAGSVGGAIFTVWFAKVAEALFRPRLGDALFDDYHRAKAWTTTWAYDAARDILRNPQAFWVGGDGDNHAAAAALLGEALEQACAELEARLGPDVAEWRWGRLHAIRFRHVLARAIPPLDELLSAGPFEAGGGDDTVNRGVFTPGEDYADAAVASYRQIIDLADFDRSLAVITTGNSGNPASPHFADQAPMWAAGEYHPMPFTRAAVEEASEGRLVLAPASTTRRSCS